MGIIQYPAKKPRVFSWTPEFEGGDGEGALLTLFPLCLPLFLCCSEGCLNKDTPCFPQDATFLLFLSALQSQQLRVVSALAPPPLSLFQEGATDALTFCPFARDARELLTSDDSPFLLRYRTPWIVPTPLVCTRLSSLSKSSTFPQQLHSCFLSHSFSHSNSVPVYTD